MGTFRLGDAAASPLPATLLQCQLSRPTISFPRATVEELSGKAERVVEEGERLPSPKERDEELENVARCVQQPVAAFQRTIVLFGESLDRLLTALANRLDNPNADLRRTKSG